MHTECSTVLVLLLFLVKVAHSQNLYLASKSYQSIEAKGCVRLLNSWATVGCQGKF
jgi:hypothetical protein